MGYSAITVSEVKMSGCEKGRKYYGVALTDGKTSYKFVVCESKDLNYVSGKNANSPWSSPAKEYKSFDEMQENFKSAKIKNLILLAEVEIMNFKKNEGI